MVHGYDPTGWDHTPPPAWEHVDSDYDPARPVPRADAYADLYSVPRRFDLASLLVVTTAYALLFAGMTVLNFPLMTFLYFALLIAVVAVAQSIFAGRYSPRSVSLIAGSAYQVTLTIALFLIASYFPRGLGSSGSSIRSWSSLMMFITIFSPVLGYLSGVLVAGTFLVADHLRTILGYLHLHRATDEGQVEAKSPWDEC